MFICTLQLQSEEATEERQLLFAGEEDHTDLFTISPEYVHQCAMISMFLFSRNYLNMVCLAEASAERSTYMYSGILYVVAILS